MAYPYYSEPAHVRGTSDPTAAGMNGARNTQTSVTEERVIIENANKIFLLEPTRTPLMSLFTAVPMNTGSYKSSSLMKEVTNNPEYSWHEDVYPQKYVQISAGIANNVTSLTLKTTANATPGHIFTKGDTAKVIRTGEVVLVTDITDATTIAVTRGFGSTAAAALLADDILFKIASASEEGAGVRNTNTTVVVKKSNQTQIFSNTISNTGTQNATALYGGPDRAYQRGKMGTEHALSIERTMWLGEKKFLAAGANGQPLRTTGGVFETLKASTGYSQTENAALTKARLNTFMQEAFTYGNQKKLFFVGPTLLSAFNNLVDSQVRITKDETSYGLSMRSWTSPFGEVVFVHHPLFVGPAVAAGGSGVGLSGTGVLLDMETIKLRVMNGRDTKTELNVQLPGVDGTVDMWRTECGLQLQQASRSAILDGVQG